MLTHRLWRRLTIPAAGLLLGSLIFAGFLLSSSGATHGATAAHASGGQCSNATLQGTYVLAVEGYLIQGSSQVTLAFAGIEVYDGHGHLTSNGTQSVGGQITRHVLVTGVYTVNSDCTESETDTDQFGNVSHFDEFIVPNGKLFALIETDPGTVISGFETQEP